MRLFLILFFLVSLPVRAETVFLKPAEALKLAFQGSEKVTSEKRTLTDQQKQDLEKQLGTAVEKTDWNIYIAKTGEKIDGYAMIANEVGKVQPITFMTVISPAGSVRSVEILVYRESHGEEVTQRKFLNQYQDKTVKDPIRIGQDIANMSGATLSSRAVTLGVKKCLAIWNIFYGEHKLSSLERFPSLESLDHLGRLGDRGGLRRLASAGA